MPLLEFWKSNPEAVQALSIQQIVNNAGNGKLLDGSACSQELRQYLSEVATLKLQEYVEACLNDKFEKSGQVLQDLVNELGRRLDYVVENGLYAGRQNAIGNDGLWASPEGGYLVVEVKTTDAYRVSLDTIAKYRHSLIGNGKVGSSSSILLVVGRQDTGELEAQVRGSRHAWDIRIISVDALGKLALLKEESNETETIHRIRSLLVPFEYTRLDALVELVFSAVSDVTTDDAKDSSVFFNEESSSSAVESLAKSGQHASEIKGLREQIVASMAAKLGTNLLRRTRATYSDVENIVAVSCTVSKPYDDGGFWYAFHPAWQSFLATAQDGYSVYGCVGQDRAYALPYAFLSKLLPRLHRSGGDGKLHWHIRLKLGSDGSMSLLVPNQAPVSIDEFGIPL